MVAARHCGGDLRPTSCSARALSAVCRHTPTCAHPVPPDSDPPLSDPRSRLRRSRILLSTSAGSLSWHVRANTVKSHLSHHLQISLTWSHPSTSWTTVKACIEGLQKGGGWQDGRRWCPWWWSAWSCPRAAWRRGRDAPWTNIMRCRSVCLSIVGVEDQVLKWGKTVEILCWQLASNK